MGNGGGCGKTSDPVILSISGLSPNLNPAAPIVDTWPSVLALQAVNKGVEGSALSGRPNLRPSPHIHLCTPRPTLTHPLGVTYTLQGPQGGKSGFRGKAQAFCLLSLQHQYIHLSIPTINPNTLSFSKSIVILPSAPPLLLLCL